MKIYSRFTTSSLLEFYWQTLRDLIKSIPGLVPEIAEHISCQLSGGASYQHTFRIPGRQLSTAFLETTDPRSSSALEYDLPYQHWPSFLQWTFSNTYYMIQDLHHTVRGTDISEIFIIRYFGKACCIYYNIIISHIKKISRVITLCLAQLVISRIFLTVSTATKQICHYKDKWLSGISYKIIYNLVLP